MKFLRLTHEKAETSALHFLQKDQKTHVRKYEQNIENRGLSLRVF